MATILEKYREKQNMIRIQIEKNSLHPQELLVTQEINYRICVLETLQSFCKTAPVTVDTKVMGFHFQLLDAYVRFVLTERRFGLKADEEGQKRRETALLSFNRVAQDGRKRFMNFSVETQEQYKKSISHYVNTILPVWLQYRNTYISI